MRLLLIAAIGCHHEGGPGKPGDATPDDGTGTTPVGTTPDGTTPDGTTPPGDCAVFPADNPWNTDISGYPVRGDSDAFVDRIGRDVGMHPDFGTTWQGAPNGIPWVEVPADQPRVPVSFRYGAQSDPGPYPIPPDAPIEGGPNSDGDRHVIALDRADCALYELWDAHPEDGGARWDAGSGAIFDLTTNDLRPDGWTSADAAGLPIYPGLVRYDEVVEDGVVPHAIRITVELSQRGYIHPATHFASDSNAADRAPMGLRLRMKPGWDCGGFSDEIQVLCTAFKTYGVIVADNGSDWYVSGGPDERWDEDAIHELGDIPGDAFEAVDTGPILH